MNNIEKIENVLTVENLKNFREYLKPFRSHQIVGYSTVTECPIANFIQASTDLIAGIDYEVDSSYVCLLNKCKDTNKQTELDSWALEVSRASSRWGVKITKNYVLTVLRTEGYCK